MNDASKRDSRKLMAGRSVFSMVIIVVFGLGEKCAVNMVGAETCPTSVEQGAGVALISAEARYAYIERALAHTQRYGQIFDRVWGLGFAGVAVVQASVGATRPFAFVDEGQQKSLCVSATKTAIGAFSHALRPTRVYRPTWEPADPCGSVADAEDKLKRTARVQRKRSGWRAHVEGLALNLSGVLVLGLGYDLWKEAAVGFTIGFVVGQIRLYTYPRHAIRAWSAYRAGDVGSVSMRGAVWRVQPMVVERGYGLAFTGAF